MAVWEPTPTGCHAWCQEEAWNFHHPQPRSRSLELGTRSSSLPDGSRRRFNWKTLLPADCSSFPLPTTAGDSSKHRERGNHGRALLTAVLLTASLQMQRASCTECDNFMPQSTRTHWRLAMSLPAAWWDQAHPCTQHHPEHLGHFRARGILCIPTTPHEQQCAVPPGVPWAASFTRFVYPRPVAVELPLDLLLPPQLHEGSAVLHALSLFGKLPGEGQKGGLRAGPRGSRMPRGLGSHGTGSRDQGGCLG